MKKSAKSRTALKTRKSKAAKRTAPRQTSAGEARTEGLRLFTVAGRPTREQLIHVYGERGPVMTWQERARAGVPAKKFQATLKAKQSGR